MCILFNPHLPALNALCPDVDLICMGAKAVAHLSLCLRVEVEVEGGGTKGQGISHFLKVMHKCFFLCLGDDNILCQPPLYL